MRLTLVNGSDAPVRIGEVVIADVEHGLPGDKPVLGEGFQKLALTGGTFADPTDLGPYPDRTHYRIDPPSPTGCARHTGC